MKNKKGISPLLAAVLLLALTISMAAIVSNYIIKKTKEFNPDTIAEQSTFCESVTLGYTIQEQDVPKFKVYEEGDDDPLNPGKKISGDGVFLLSPITFVNRGSFSIYQLIINAPGLQSTVYPIINAKKRIEPGANNKYVTSLQINPSDKNRQIKIVPVINDSEKNVLVKCTDRQLIVDYTVLCTDLKKDLVADCKIEE